MGVESKKDIGGTKVLKVTTTIFCLCCLLFFSFNTSAFPAFPGAEGFGAETIHARGKKVFIVDRLDDFPKSQKMRYLAPGQFRYALANAENNGGGYIVFNVSGTIHLKRNAVVPSNVYVAGQTSAGGIAFEGGAIVIKDSHDVVIRHIRHREAAKKGDAFNIVNSKNIVIDHVSISFFKDGAIDIVGNSENISIQWTHMGDAVRSGSKEEPYHCQPNLIRDGPDRITFHHNFYTHGHSRMPLVKSSAKAGCLIDFSNNVVYNFRKYPSVFAAPDGKANVIGNFYIPGPNSHGDSEPGIRPVEPSLLSGITSLISRDRKDAVAKARPPVKGSNNFSVFVKDNYMVGGMGHFPVKTDGRGQHIERGRTAWVTGARPNEAVEDYMIMGTGQGKFGPNQGVFNRLDKRVECIPKLTLQPAMENLSNVLSSFGALPRDNTDKRLVSEILTKSGNWKYDKPMDGNVYHHNLLQDSDGDGLPDSFEQTYSKNLHPNGHDLDPVYENMEVYLNGLHEKLISKMESIDTKLILQTK